MKKRYRFAAAILCWSLVFCSCGSPAASAEDISELGSNSDASEYEGPWEGSLEGGFSWIIDKATKTLTISGEGVLPESMGEIPWSYDYRFNKIILEGQIDVNSSYGFMIRTAFSYEVDSNNPYLAVYDDCLYTKDYKKLVRCAYLKTNIRFHPNMEIIGARAFYETFPSSASITWYGQKMRALVIPWGVTTMEDHQFGKFDGSQVMIPDTLVNIDMYANDGATFHDTPFHYQLIYTNTDIVTFSHYKLNRWVFSQELKKILQDKGYSSQEIKKIMQDDGPGHGSIYDFQYFDFYGVKPNSLHTFENGKTYYFGPNYEYAKGWKQASGNWYYFNDYGAAVVKCWKQSGGKWFYMQADGTMAKNKWVEWYKKWYYVGADGAMYANRKTPDGYWVNGSGVWVK